MVTKRQGVPRSGKRDNSSSTMKSETFWLLIIIVIIFIGNYLGYSEGWYFNLCLPVTCLYDIPMHIAGGIWIGLLFFYLKNRFGYGFFGEKNLVWDLVSVLGFVAIVGVFWEFYEYLLDVFVQKKYPFGGEGNRGVLDTLKDLFDDLIGGALAFLLYKIGLFGKEKA